MRKWNIIESKYIFSNPFGKLRKDKCLLPSGVTIAEYYVNEYPDWVNIIALTKDLQVVFITQYRHGCKDFILEIPGGGKKDEEDEKEAVLRELAEETGYRSTKEPILLANLYTNPAIATNKIKTFLVLDVEKVSEQNLDDTEEIDITLIPFNEVSKKIKEGELTQFFSVAAYYLALEYLIEQKIL